MFLVRRHLILFLSSPYYLCSPFSSSCKRILSSKFTAKPPQPKKIPYTISAHGKTWEDPYHWMSNVEDPDFSTYLNLENTYADAFMAETQWLQKKLLSEMKNRMPSEVSSPPQIWGPWLYYEYIPKGKEYPVFCRKLGPHCGLIKTFINYMLGPEEEVLLDWNEIAREFGYVHIGTCRVSPDHKLLAYTLDISGNETFFLQVKDIQSGLNIPKATVNRVVNFSWLPDGSSLLYTVSDDTQRPHRVLYKDLEYRGEDALLFTEIDPSCCVDISSTKDGNYITVNSNSRSSSEVYVIDSLQPNDGLKRVRKRVPGVQYFLEHHHGFFYILTNNPSKNSGLAVGDYYLARCNATFPCEEWEEVIFPGENISFNDMDIFNGHLVFLLQRQGLPCICSVTIPIDANQKSKLPVLLEDLDPWFFPLPSNTCSIAPGSNHDFMSSTYRAVLSSPTMPDVIIDYDMGKRTFTIVHQEEDITNNAGPSFLESSRDSDLLDTHIHKNHDVKEHEGLQRGNEAHEAFFCERREVISCDGTPVPLTILYSKGLEKNGKSPGLLYGYGAYGENLEKSCHEEHTSLLNRGWVIAYADVRGGEGGVAWHRAGSKLNKRNSMYDFIACGKYLILEGYVCEGQLSAAGFSAGGLLVAASVNMFPNLFRAAILKVPFLDVCNTLLDPNLPLTILDYEEFGDPRNETEFEYIRSYSPYDNIPSGACMPSVLVTASFNDTRVGVWEAAKWVASVRDKVCPRCSLSIILKTNMSSGHFGEGGRFKEREEDAFAFSFLIKAVGLLDEE